MLANRQCLKNFGFHRMVILGFIGKQIESSRGSLSHCSQWMCTSSIEMFDVFGNSHSQADFAVETVCSYRCKMKLCSIEAV